MFPPGGGWRGLGCSMSPQNGYSWLGQPPFVLPQFPVPGALPAPSPLCCRLPRPVWLPPRCRSVTKPSARPSRGAQPGAPSAAAPGGSWQSPGSAGLLCWGGCPGLTGVPRGLSPVAEHPRAPGTGGGSRGAAPVASAGVSPAGSSRRPPRDRLPTRPPSSRSSTGPSSSTSSPGGPRQAWMGSSPSCSPTRSASQTRISEVSTWLFLAGAVP